MLTRDGTVEPLSRETRFSGGNRDWKIIFSVQLATNKAGAARRDHHARKHTHRRKMRVLLADGVGPEHVAKEQRVAMDNAGVTVVRQGMRIVRVPVDAENNKEAGRKAQDAEDVHENCRESCRV